MELSTALSNLIEQEALGQTLTEWGNFTYDEIIEALYNEDDTVLEHEDFMFWDGLSDMSPSQLAEYIESIVRAMAHVAVAAKEGK